MTRPLSVSTSLVFLMFAGCQVAHDSLPWFGANDPVYTEQQLASMAPSGPVLADNTATQPTANNPISTVSATTTTPASNTQVEQLVQSGRATIQQANNNPVMLQQARGLFEQALQLNPQHGAANQGLAIVADLQKDWPTAEAHYKQALSQNPQDPDLLNDLGYSYLLQNRFHESMQYLNQALQVSPRHERAHINLAMLSLKSGDITGATNRLATIYPQQEVQTTLAQLQNELAKTATTIAASPQTSQPNAVGQPNAMPNNGNAAPAPTQPWPRNAYPAPQTNALVNTHPSSNANSGANATAPIEERPISVYPPGVVPRDDENPAVAETPGQLQPGLNSLTVPGQPMLGGLNGGPNNLVPNNIAGQQPAGQPFTGVPVGGVIAMPPAVNSNPGVPSVTATPNATVAPNPSVGGQPLATPNAVPQPANASVLGLNAGPGTLFPIPVQPTTSVAPAPYSHATQTAPSGQPVIPNQPVQNVVRAPANYGAVPNGTSPYGVAAQPAPFVNQQPAAAPGPYYPQPAQPSAAAPGLPMNGYVPGAVPNPAAGVQMQPVPAGQPAQNYNTHGAIRGVSAQNGAAPLTSASMPAAAAAIPQHLTAPPVPVATQPGTGRPSPLAAYEQQLRNLDNQYNATLQNMNAQPAPAAAPNGTVYR